MLHAVTHAPIPIPTAPAESIARVNFGTQFAQTAWKLFEEDRCRIEFAGATHINSDDLMGQAWQNNRIRDRHAPNTSAYSRTQAGHELIAAIASQLKAQAAPGQNIDDLAHAYTAAATICTEPFWKAEAMTLRTISLRSGIDLPTLPSVVSARITPLEDGTGWRINKLMKWHSYTDADGSTRYMSNLRPVLTIDHQIEFRCDANDPPLRSILNWFKGRDPERYEVGDLSDIIHVACLAPALDQALTTMQPDGGNLLIRLLSRLFHCLSDLFHDMLDDCRRRDGVAYRRISAAETEPFRHDRPSGIGHYRSGAVAEDQSLTPIQLHEQRETGNRKLVPVEYKRADERHYVARRTDRELNGSGSYVFEAVDAEHRVMRQTTADGDIRPSLQSVLHQSRGMEPPQPVRSPSPHDDVSDIRDDDSEDHSVDESSDQDVAPRASAPAELADTANRRAPIPVLGIAASEPGPEPALDASWIMVPETTS